VKRVTNFTLDPVRVLNILVAWLRLSAALATVLVASPTAAEAINCEVPDGIAYTRPSKEATEVSLSVALVKLHGIFDTSQTFSGDLFAVGTWRDPRLTAEILGYSLEGCRINPDRIWSPRLQVLNLRNVKFPLSEVEVDSNGGVVRRIRIIGEFGMPMDLRDYPFDQQDLKITFVSLYGPDEIAIRIDNTDQLAFADIDILGWRSIPDSATVTVSPVLMPGRNHAAAGVTVAISMTREPGFHLWKLIFPITMIVFMAWGVFWIDPGNLNPQVGLSSSAALTFVAFQLGLGDLLPPIDYLTRADRFIIGSQLLVFLALAEAITAAHLFANGSEKLARNLDWWSRIAYPVCFVLVLCFSFWI